MRLSISSRGNKKKANARLCHRRALSVFLRANVVERKHRRGHCKRGTTSSPGCVTNTHFIWPQHSTQPNFSHSNSNVLLWSNACNDSGASEWSLVEAKKNVFGLESLKQKNYFLGTSLHFASFCFHPFSPPHRPTLHHTKKHSNRTHSTPTIEEEEKQRSRNTFHIAFSFLGFY